MVDHRLLKDRHIRKLVPRLQFAETSPALAVEAHEGDVAQPLRRAMLAYLSAPPHEENANPAYWGPFSVVGEGSAR